jgi:DNA-binding MarR family transcriptional regulator
MRTVAKNRRLEADERPSIELLWPPDRRAATPRDRSTSVRQADRLKLSLKVHLRVACCRNLLMREARRSVERWGLTLPQFDVLAELERNKRRGFTFGELSRLLLVTSGNLTGIVDHLEADGLARRQHDKTDGRVVRIVLTRKGRRLVQQIVPHHARDIEAALEFLPDDRLQMLEQLLHETGHGLHNRVAGAKPTDIARPARPRRSE